MEKKTIPETGDQGFGGLTKTPAKAGVFVSLSISRILYPTNIEYNEGGTIVICLGQ